MNELGRLRLEWKKAGQAVILTNGCFDILHPGHIYLFREAKKLGDVLIVAVNSDESVRMIKGPSRPIFPLEERLEILSSIENIDHLVSFKEETPRQVIASLLPDVLVKGGDWGFGQIVGRKEVEKAGGRVILIPYQKGKSTSKIIKKILEN
ncbi:MAG: D-glycero-beta-D-manno-heptose 1-phosphate adenylyltransferase [Acidobacteriota bacterium]